MRKSANYPAVLLSVFIIVAVYVYLTQNDDTLEQPLYTLAPELPHAPPLQLPTADHAVPVPATWPRSLGIPAAEIKQIEVEEKLINTTTWDTNGPPIPVLGVTVFVNADLLLRLLNRSGFLFNEGGAVGREVSKWPYTAGGGGVTPPPPWNPPPPPPDQRGHCGTQRIVYRWEI